MLSSEPDFEAGSTSNPGEYTAAAAVFSENRAYGVPLGVVQLKSYLDFHQILLEGYL